MTSDHGLQFLELHLQLIIFQIFREGGKIPPQ